MRPPPCHRSGRGFTGLVLVVPLALTSEVSAREGVKPRPPVAVVDAATEFWTCSTAMVIGLGRRGSYLSVRAGPGIAYPRIGRLIEGQQIFICDERDEWLGAVYGSGGRCRALKQVQTRTPLPKGCHSGWTHRRWIEITSG